MRLPSHVLAALVGLSACESAHPEPQCKSEPVVEHVVEHRVQPMAGPKVVQPPQPQQPQPVAKKPQKRMVWASVCGHSQLVEDKTMLVKCGKG